MTEQVATILTSAAITIVGMIIAVVPPTIAALAALKQGKENGVKADAAKTAADLASTKADQLAAQTQEIHEMTNGNLSAVTDNLAAANARIADLHAIIVARQNPQEGSKGNG